jgi:hypothetical protein
MDSGHDIGLCDDQWCLVKTRRKRAVGDALYFDVSAICYRSTVALERDADIHKWIDLMFVNWWQWDLVGNERSRKLCGSIWIGKDCFGPLGVHLNSTDGLGSRLQVCTLLLVSLVIALTKLFSDYCSYSTKIMYITIFPFEDRYLLSDQYLGPFYRLVADRMLSTACVLVPSICDMLQYTSIHPSIRYLLQPLF